MTHENLKVSELRKLAAKRREEAATARYYAEEPYLSSALCLAEEWDKEADQLEAQAASRTIVEDALDYINAFRRQVHQSPLNPLKERWSDDDVVLEAKRLGFRPEQVYTS